MTTPTATYANAFGTFTVDARDKIVADVFAERGAWSLPLVLFLQRTCFPKGVGTFIDVGAHVGLVTIPIARAFPGVYCLALEPAEENMRLLRANIEQNGSKNVHAMRLAIGEVDTPAVWLARSAENTVDHRVEPVGSPGQYGEEHRGGEVVRCMRLDTLVRDPDPPRPVVLKLDAQGSEGRILRGAGALSPDVIVIEIWPYGLRRAGETIESMLAALSGYNFCAPLFHNKVELQPSQGLLEGLLRSSWNHDEFTFDIVLAKERT